MPYLLKYNTSATIYFPLIKVATNNFAVTADYTHVSGDIKISKDGGTAATATNSPTQITMGNGAMWSLVLTATELQASQVLVTIIDATTKAVEDQMIIIEIYGDGSGQIDLRDWADSLLKRDWTAISGEALRSVLNALRMIRNKWSISGTTMTITKEDDTTTAFTSALTTQSAADSITSSDPT